LGAWFVYDAYGKCNHAGFFKMNLFLINRVLYGILGLVLSLGVMVWFVPKQRIDYSDVKPVKVTRLKIADRKVSGPELLPPSRNIFDVQGKLWQKNRPLSNDKSRQHSENNLSKSIKVTGIVRLPGLEGVLTSQGFYKVGKKLNGGKLVGVSDGEYILDFSGVHKRIAIDTTRARRRKRFDSIGFPFLD